MQFISYWKITYPSWLLGNHRIICVRRRKIYSQERQRLQLISKRICIKETKQGSLSVAETWRRVWGTEKFFADQDWRFSEKISISTAKISDDLFLSHWLAFRIFPFFSQIFRIFYYVQCRIWPFPHKNNHFFYSVRTFARIQQHCLSKYWGGRMHRLSLHLKFLGDRPLFP